MSNESTGAPTVWLMAHGSDGEYEHRALDLSLALLGFQNVPDLTGKSEEEIEALIPRVEPYRSRSTRAQIAVAGMMKSFALRMQVGDVIASPLVTQQGQLALGTVAGGYQFREIDGAMRHTRPVVWNPDTVARADFGADAFHYLVAKMTISRIRDTSIAKRLRLAHAGKWTGASITQSDEPDAGSADFDVEESARDQIVERIHSRFPDRNLEHLVAALLEAQGFVVQESEPGKDQGVDVLAGHGPLGFDRPRICVQVKHTSSRIGQPDVQQLHGAMRQFGADQGLFVSWSDYTSDARQMARLNFFSMRLWNRNDLLDAVFQYYEELPEDIQNEVPLKRIWTLVEEEDD